MTIQFQSKAGTPVNFNHNQSSALQKVGQFRGLQVSTYAYQDIVYGRMHRVLAYKEGDQGAMNELVHMTESRDPLVAVNQMMDWMNKQS